MDAAAFIKGHIAEYDVVIVDSSDPVGTRHTQRVALIEMMCLSRR
jgi:spermidine synthase